MTAQAICRPKNLPLHRCRAFREVCFGVWEDHTFGYIDHFDMPAMDRFRLDPRRLRVKGGERFEEYTSRFIDAMTGIAREYDGKTVAIFSHGAVLRGVLMELFGYGAQGGHAKNAQYAFDKFGRGAIVSASRSILGAWQKTGDEAAYQESARAAAMKMRDDIVKYLLVI